MKSIMLVSYMKVAWVLCAILLLPVTPWASEEKKLASVACSDTVLLRVSDGASRQGSIAVVEVRSETPLDSVDGFAAGETLFFWHDADARVFQALLGVDLRRSSGTMSLRARVAPQFGEPVDCRLELPIGKGEFPVQRLAVAPKYVELSADDLARSQRESRELDRIFSSTTRERLWQGGFQSPVPGRKASGNFGKRRIFNNQPRSPHSGEDFSAPTGTPVLATARGRVALAKDLFFLGRTVILDHGFGLYSFYGHLSSLGVEPGTNVQSGTVIGKVGATGRVTGPHLHWGVRLGNARVNPMELLALAR